MAGHPPKETPRTQVTQETPEAREQIVRRRLSEGAEAHTFLDRCSIPRIAEQKDEEGRLVELTLKQRIVQLDSHWANSIGEPDAPDEREAQTDG